MTNVGKFAYDTLIGSTVLTALVPATQIYSSRPEVITTFPGVYFSDEQSDNEFVDNLPVADSALITIDIYIRDDSPYDISKIVCDLMKGLFWACMTNIDAPDPDTAVRHRHLVFGKMLFQGDI